MENCPTKVRLKLFAPSVSVGFMDDIKDSDIYPKYTFRISEEEKLWLNEALAKLKIKFNDPSLGEFQSVSKSAILASALKIGIRYLEERKPLFIDTIEKKCFLRADSVTVWKSLTEPQQIAQWWQEGIRLEPIVGGIFHEPWTDQKGEAHLASGTVTAVEEHRYISFTWREREWPPQLVTHCSFFLENRDDGTGLVLRHSGWQKFSEGERERLQAGFSAGWDSILKSLQAYHG